MESLSLKKGTWKSIDESTQGSVHLYVNYVEPRLLEEVKWLYTHGLRIQENARINATFVQKVSKGETCFVNTREFILIQGPTLASSVEKLLHRFGRKDFFQ